MTYEIRRIILPIRRYLQAVKNGTGFDRAFHQDATIIDADNERRMTVSDFETMVKDLIDKGLVVEERPQAVTLGYVGNIANVRLDFELQIGDDLLYGTDYFNLVKCTPPPKRRRWRISQKIYSVTRASKVP